MPLVSSSLAYYRWYYLWAYLYMRSACFIYLLAIRFHLTSCSTTFRVSLSLSSVFNCVWEIRYYYWASSWRPVTPTELAINVFDYPNSSCLNASSLISSGLGASLGNWNGMNCNLRNWCWWIKDTYVNASGGMKSTSRPIGTLFDSVFNCWELLYFAFLFIGDPIVRGCVLSGQWWLLETCIFHLLNFEFCNV